MSPSASLILKPMSIAPVARRPGFARGAPTGYAVSLQLLEVMVARDVKEILVQHRSDEAEIFRRKVSRAEHEADVLETFPHSRRVDQGIDLVGYAEYPHRPLAAPVLASISWSLSFVRSSTDRFSANSRAERENPELVTIDPRTIPSFFI